VVAVLFSVVGAFFYLRIVKLIVFRRADRYGGHRRVGAHADGTQRECVAGVRGWE